MTVDQINLFILKDFFEQKVIQTVSTINDIEIFVVRQFQIVKLDSLMVPDTNMAWVMMRYDYGFADFGEQVLCKLEDMDLDASQKGITKI